MTLTDDTLREAVVRRLCLNETPVWFGKPRPRAFTRQSTPVFVFGLIWCGMLSLNFAPFLEQLAQKADRDSLIAGILLLPFAAVGLGTLLAPLWHYIRMTGLTYAVTDRRAVCIGRFSTRGWSAGELMPVERCDRRNGLSDLFFTVSAGRRNHVPDGFLCLPPEAADAAEQALCALRRRHQA